MTAEDNKSIMRRFFGMLSSGDLSPAEELVAEDYVNHNPIPGQQPGREGFKAFVSRFHSAFPDVQIAIDDEVAEGDNVVFRYHVAGTHQGEFMGVAATGKPLTWQAIMQAKVNGGQVREIWLQWDRLAIMQQLGIIPKPG